MTAPFKTRIIEHNGHQITGKNQTTVFLVLRDRRPVRGATSREIETLYDMGHGSVSGALSKLHQDGVIACLKETRNHQRIYVLPENVNGRDTVEYHEFHCKCCRYRVQGE